MVNLRGKMKRLVVITFSIFLCLSIPVSLLADTLSPEERSLMSLLDKYRDSLKDVADRMSKAKPDETVRLGADEERLITETSRFFNELLTMKKGTQAYQGLRGKVSNWNSDYLGIERALMMGRALIVQKVFKETLIDFYNQNPEAIGTIYGEMDIGTWVKMQTKTLQFDKDIDFSTLSSDDNLNMRLRDSFRDNLQKIAGVTDERIMINMDALITPHGRASSEVFIGEWGKTFAEMDLLQRGKWKLIMLKLQDGSTVTPDEAKRLREQGKTIKVVDIVTREMPGTQLFWWRAFMEGKDFDPPKVTMQTEPMLSLEMSRHLIADIERGNFTGVDKLLKMMKYVERSYFYNKKATAAYSNEWNPFTDNDNILGEFATELTKAKQAKNSTLEMAKVMEKYKEQLGLEGLIKGDKSASDEAINQLLKRAKSSIIKNSEVALALRLRHIAAIKDEKSRNRDLDHMLEQMSHELEVYREHVGNYPEGRIRDIIWLARKLREGDKWSADVVRQTMDDLIKELSTENYQIEKGIIEYIFSPDDARQLRLYLREQMKWTEERINKFIEDLRKKYPSLARGYDRLRSDYENIGKELPTFKKIHDRIVALNEEWSNTIEGSTFIKSLDFADNLITFLDAGLSEENLGKAFFKMGEAYLKVKATGALPSLQIAEGIMTAYQEGDSGPAIKAFAFYYFPTIGVFWGLGEKLQRFDVFVRDQEFLSHLDDIRSIMLFDPKTGHITGIKTGKYEDVFEFQYSPNQEQRANNFADFFMKSDNLLSPNDLPKFRFWLSLIPRDASRYGYGSDTVKKGDELLSSAGKTWIGEKLGLGAMDISGKKAKYARLKKYFGHNEDLLTAVLILENANEAPRFTELAGVKLAKKRDEFLQRLEDNIEREMWKSLFYLLEASATPPEDLKRLIEQLTKIEFEIKLGDTALTDIRGYKGGLLSTIEKEIKAQLSKDYYGKFIYEDYYKIYSQIRKIQSEIILLWTQKYDIDWQKITDSPLKEILCGSKTCAPRLTLDKEKDLENAQKSLNAHLLRGRTVDNDLYNALGHSPKDADEREHRRKLAQLAFEAEHLLDDCKDREIENCEQEIIDAYTKRTKAYREYLSSLKKPICTYEYSDWSPCDEKTGRQTRRLLAKTPDNCIEKEKPIIEQTCQIDTEKETQRAERERLEQEKREKERLEKERAERERLERERAERERLVQEKKKQEEERKRLEEEKKKEPPTCTYEYSEWGECVRATKKQTRTVIAKKPEGCIERQKPEIERGCTPPPTEKEKRKAFLDCLCRYCGGSLGGHYAIDGECAGGCACWGPLSGWCTPIPYNSDAIKDCYSSAYGVKEPDAEQLKKANEFVRNEIRKTMKPLKVRLNYDKCPIHIQLGDIVNLSAVIEGGIPPYKVSWSGNGDAKDNQFTFINSRQPGTHPISITVNDDFGNTSSINCSIVVEAVNIEIIKTLPAPNIIPVGGKASFKAIVKSGVGSASGQFKYLWQPHPEVQFGDDKNPLFETTSPETTAIYKRTGKFPMWVQVLKKIGDSYQTVGESNQIMIEVVSPKIKLTADKTNPLVGEKVIISVEEEPKISDDAITFWWEIRGNADNPGPEPNIPNNRKYSFKPKDEKPVKVIAHAKSRYDGSDLGSSEITISPKSYTVQISEPRYLGPKPMIWKCDTQLGGHCPGLVEVSDTQFAVHRDIFMKAIVTPTPDSPRYKWTVEPAGSCGFPGAGSEIKINCSNTGTYTVKVEVTNAEGIKLGEATRSVSITISQEQIDNSKKSKEAYDKLQKAKQLVKEGKIDEAVSIAQEVSKIDKTLAQPVMNEIANVAKNNGWDALSKGDYKTAIKRLEQAVSLNPNDADAQKKLKEAKDYQAKMPMVEAKLKEFDALIEQKRIVSSYQKLLEIQDILRTMTLGQSSNNPVIIKMNDEYNKLNKWYNELVQKTNAEWTRLFQEKEWEKAEQLLTEVLKYEHTEANKKNYESSLQMVRRELSEKRQAQQYYEQAKANNEKGMPADVKGIDDVIRELKNRQNKFKPTEKTHQDIQNLIAEMDKRNKAVSAKNYAMNLFTAGDDFLKTYLYSRAADAYFEGLKAIRDNGDINDPIYARYYNKYQDCIAKDKRNFFQG